jgi:hypothetical protein
MLSKSTVDRVKRGLERRELWDRADQAAVPVLPPTMWCVYYTGERTNLALEALNGTIQFAERDEQPDPKQGDLAFAAPPAARGSGSSASAGPAMSRSRS